MLFCTLLSIGLLAASLGYITHTFWQYRESEQYYESVRDEYLNAGESVPLMDPEKNPEANESGLSEDFPATDALEAGESVSYTPRNVNFSRGWRKLALRTRKWWLVVQSGNCD